MSKFKETFFYEFITSFPFKLFIFGIILFAIIVSIQKCNKTVQMKEEILYVKPNAKT